MKKAVSVLLVAVGVGLLGCATPAGPGRCKVRVILETTAQVNLDVEGQSLPTTLRLFQLKDYTQFEKASFDDLWTRHAEALGEELLEQHEAVIYPNQKQALDILVNDEARVLGAMAVFRTPDQQTWRTYIRFPPAGTVERCEEGKLGGPYFFHLSGSKIQGSLKPFSEGPITSEEEAAAREREKKDKGDWNTRDPIEEGEAEGPDMDFWMGVGTTALGGALALGLGIAAVVVDATVVGNELKLRSEREGGTTAVLVLAGGSAAGLAVAGVGAAMIIASQL